MFEQLEEIIKKGAYNTAMDIFSAEKETLRKRNKILKIADKHGRDTVQEYLESPLADDKDDAANLKAAIRRASRKRNYIDKAYNRPAEKVFLQMCAVVEIQDLIQN